MNYRAEIDGLRALAVLPVILFHAGIFSFEGGFFGVDIFFVISGYLITTLIFLQRSKKSFFLVNFYERRARRLLPALFFMMMACIPFAVMMMQPDDLENFGQSLISSSLMANNILLYLTAGYWDLASEFKPLLHTWSLGVEEQYYILFPIIVMMLGRLSFLKKLIFFFLISVSSLLFAFHIQTSNPNAEFYLLSSRIWEIGAGACLALYIENFYKPSRTNIFLYFREIFSVIGLAFLAWPLLYFDPLSNNLILYRIIIVVGTLLLILFADKSTIIGKLLSLPFLVSIGLISYSLYLWHQPIFAFLRIGSLEEPSTHAYAIAILATLLISIFSRKLELFFKDSNKSSFKVFSIFIGISMLTCILSGYVFIKSYGFYSHYDELQSKNIQLNSNIISNPDKDFLISAKNSLVGRFDPNSLNKNLLVVGDSYTNDFINMGVVNGFFDNYDIVRPALNCVNFDNIQHDYHSLIHQADIIVITYRYLNKQGEFDCLNKKLAKIRDLEKYFIFIGPKDFGYNINAPLRKKLYDFAAVPSKNIIEFNNFLKSSIDKGNYIDLIELLSDDEGRISLFTTKNKLISYDRAHLTFFGAEEVGKILFENLEVFFDKPKVEF